MQSLLEPWLLFIAQDPVLRALQGGMLLLAVFLVFLVFYATRDILLRTESFLVMILCIALVALLPIIGFLFYLIVRPSRTLRERENDLMLLEIHELLRGRESLVIEETLEMAIPPTKEDMREI